MNAHRGVSRALMAAGLVIVAGLGWYALRVHTRAHNRTSEEIIARLDQRTKALTRLSQKMGATVRALGGLRNDLVQMLERLSPQLKKMSAQVITTEEPGSTKERERIDEEENLPPLPKGVPAPALLSGYRKSHNVWDIIKNPLLNPQGKKPDPLEGVMILRELVHANAQIDMLRTDVQVRVAEARLVLADAGEYIDYAPGERYMTPDDAVTLGEKTEGGNTRMYYMYAEEFPEIHEKRAEQKRVAERALRRILWILE